MNKVFIGIVILIIWATIIPVANAFSDSIGIGYITKEDNTSVYSYDEGSDVDAKLNKNFSLVAYDIMHFFSGDIMASEQESKGRLHVRYWKNGKDSADGENTGWVNPKDVIKFQFECCGVKDCSGIEASMSRNSTYTDCFNMAVSETIEKLSVKKEDNTGDRDKLKHEQRKLKSQNTNQQPATGNAIK